MVSHEWKHKYNHRKTTLMQENITRRPLLEENLKEKR